MIYTPKTKRALKLCFEAHKNQVDKSGTPYVFHPFHVAEQMADEASTIVALLHDVVEDTDYTMDDIAAMDFGAEVVEALSLLTRDDATPYLEYIASLRSNPIARAVKRADLLHNSDLSRLDTVTLKDEERVRKYKAALAILDDWEAVCKTSKTSTATAAASSAEQPATRWDMRWSFRTRTTFSQDTAGAV